MKKYLTLSLLIICSVCKGQDTLTYRFEKDSFSVFDGNNFLSKWPIPATDTLFSDGSLSGVLPDQSTNPFMSSLYGHEMDWDTVKVQMLCSSNDEQNNKVAKIIGYKVVPSYGQVIISYDGKEPEPEYLDIIKQPLNKKLTVWMCKEIK